MKTLPRNNGSVRSGSMTATTTLSILRTPFSTHVLGDTLSNAYRELVPEYKSRSYSHLVLRVSTWSDRYSQDMWNISERRARNRIENYLLPDELERVAAKLSVTDECSIRFGREKKGHGYHGERGDFCLSSGAVKGKHLTLFYRSLELIGGLAYDLCIINALAEEFDIQWKTVTIHAAKANVFALKGNSNEKLYPKFRRVLGI